MVVDIYGLLSYISAKLLDELARHPCTSEMGCEPVATAMWAEMILHVGARGIVQAYSSGRHPQSSGNATSFYVSSIIARP